MPKTFEIAGRKIGPGHPTYVIAEISANHNGSLERTKDLITRAKNAGADAVKIQTYTADTMTIEHDGPGFVVEDGPWKGRHLHELYDKAHMPWEWHAPLFEHAKAVGITLFSTPFDTTAVELLERLNAPAYKIASFELTDIPLISAVARTGKPMIMSTGMANREEIADAVNAAKAANASGIVLLHCVSGYPSLPRESNLRNIENLANTFGVAAGLSDHTLGSAVSVAAAALGANVIEKHFTLRRADGGEDSHFSLEPEEFKRLCEEVRQGWEAIGKVTFEKQASESGHADYRRSLYVVENIAAGEPFTSRNVRAIRPGFGLAPKHYDQVMQSTAAVDLSRGTPLKLEHLRSK
ncbi:MAG: pseudaminic acid synthase [Xanthobacteraceae bacterium]|nr:pseudaminic acid synthase [Xanthobacteraceae bacterium]